MKNWRIFSGYLENILIAIFLALLVRTFVISTYKVPTTSMIPALIPGDFIMSFHLPYGVLIPLANQKLFAKVPERWEVIVFRYADQPQTSFVKRVVALPGERVEIKKGRIWLNEQEVSYEPAVAEGISDYQGDAQPYLEAGSHTILSHNQADFGPFIVPPDEVFVLGDNRDVSDDSRYWGTVSIQNIDGRVVGTLLSVNWAQRNSLGFPALRKDRLFKLVH